MKSLHSLQVHLNSCCIYLLFISYIARAKGSVQTIVAESTTLRRHIEANHLVWAYFIILKFPETDQF